MSRHFESTGNFGMEDDNISSMMLDVPSDSSSSTKPVHRDLRRHDMLHERSASIPESNLSMLSIQEGGGVVEKRTTSTEEERGDNTEERKSPESWRQQDYDDMEIHSVSSFQTIETNATSESVQTIIQQLNSETDRRRRRLMRRRSLRSASGGMIIGGSDSRRSQLSQSRHEGSLSGITLEIREQS